MNPYIRPCNLEPGPFCRDCEVEAACGKWQSYRNHWRRRLLVLGLMVCAVIVVLGSVIQSKPAHPPPGVGGIPPALAQEVEYVDVWQKYGLEAIPVASRPHIVRPGEQLFHVAMQHRLPGPVQMTVDIIKELNNLWDRPLLHPGQRLRVPETDRRQWPIAIQKAWAGK